MKKFNVILDLDQTLISAEADEEFDFEKSKDKAKLFDFKDMDGLYLVFERPYLQKFLDFLFKNFNVSIWTAASKDYALFIINKIILANKPKRKIDYIFFSYHCDISKKIKKGTKDLSMLWDIYKLKDYNKDNTFIIDDYDEVFETQPENCIIAKEFQFNEEGSEKDTYLKNLITHLKKIKTKKYNRSPAYHINKELQIT
jgi:TFIIF-interacting CTD phosphatase-like protein